MASNVKRNNPCVMTAHIKQRQSALTKGNTGYKLKLTNRDDDANQQCLGAAADLHKT